MKDPIKPEEKTEPSNDVTVQVKGVSSKGAVKEEGDMEHNTEFLNDR